MKRIINVIILFCLLVFLTGLAYPLLITGIAVVFFPEKANGSLVYNTDHKTIGSVLIGQRFIDNKYFFSRPSAVGYNPLPSGGTNSSLISNILKDSILSRRNQFITKNDLDSTTVVPKDMLFSSASGLDPDISPEAANAQIERIAMTRKFSVKQKQSLHRLITNLTCAPQLNFLGKERVNVLALNIGLDSITRLGK